MKLSMPGPVRDLLEGARSRNLTGRFGRDAAGMLALRVTFAVCYGVANIFLARILGAADYGSYTFAAAWLMLLGIPTVLGMDRFLVREVATYSVQGAWGQMRALLRQSNAHVLALSVTTGLLAAAVTWFIPWHSSSTMQVSFWIVLIALPFYSLKRALQAALQGLQHVIAGALPEMLITPSVLLVTIALGWRIWRPLHAPSAVAMLVLAHVIGFLVAIWLLRHFLPETARTATAVPVKLPWARSLFPLVFLSSMNVIYAQADLIALGTLKGARAVGFYGVADRNAELVNFLLIAVSLPLAPAVATIYALGDMQRLQVAVTKVVRVTFFLSLPVAAAFILFGYWWLLLLYGADFTEGRWPLAILSAGQLATAWTGPAVVLLTMTGHERDAARAIFISAAVNIILCLALISRWGPEGAAVAAASSAAVWSMLLAKAVRNRLGIRVSAFGATAV
jgi:O-antigen/teichoic acid export membrane protein